MYRYLLSCLHSEWGQYFQEYKKWIDSKSVEEATEIVILTLRGAIQLQIFEIEDSELNEKDIRKNWLSEIIQKDEFIKFARKEAKQRKKRNPKKENFKIAIESVSAALRNIYKDMQYREKNKRTYAKPELISLVSSLPINFENEKVSKKTFKLLGFVDVEKETNLSNFAELYQKYKQQAQKTFLLTNLIFLSENPKKKKRRKRKKSSGSSSSNPAPAQLSLI